MTRRERSLVAAWLSVAAGCLLVAAVAYLADTFDRPHTVPLEYTPTTLPRAVP